jgi:hypothetical protein
MRDGYDGRTEENAHNDRHCGGADGQTPNRACRDGV